MTAVLHLNYASEAHADLDRAKRKQLMSSSVFLLAANYEDGRLEPVSSGSGTIVSADGAILTNHHVLIDPARGAPYDVVIVGLMKAYDADPVKTCLAFPRHGLHEPELDLAVIKCELDLERKPYVASDWPAIALGDASDIVPGDPIYIIGYPGVGGSTVHLTAGRISGFQGADGGAGKHWLKTDASINHGNSGGTAVDESGRLVGVPSAFRMARTHTGETMGSMGLVRPVFWAGDLIARARAGWTPEGPVPAAATADVAASQRQRAVRVGSRILDASSGRPVAGAIIVILKPGVQVSEVNRNNIRTKYLTKATSRRDGSWYAEDPVPTGTQYSVIVVADGYRPLYEDGVLDVRQDPPDEWDPWGQIRLAPE